MPAMVTDDGFNENTVSRPVDEQQFVELDAIKCEAERCSDLSVSPSSLDLGPHKIRYRQTVTVKRRIFPKLGPRIR